MLTGGPGAGKTAVLELIRRHFCHHVVVLPEAASMLFGGGFPRGAADGARRAVQRAIFHVQRELESLPEPEQGVAMTVCDRGTLDGIAYWPGAPDEMLADVGTTLTAELARYAAVVHLRTPPVEHGYNHNNVLRTEPPALAAEIDARIFEVWRDHPRRFVVDSHPNFLVKATQALRILRDELPACCRGQVVLDGDAGGNRVDHDVGGDHSDDNGGDVP